MFAGRWLWSASQPALARFRRTDYLGDPQEPRFLERAIGDVQLLLLKPESRHAYLGDLPRR